MDTDVWALYFFKLQIVDKNLPKLNYSYVKELL